jgi:hypothetical protein
LRVIAQFALNLPTMNTAPADDPNAGRAAIRTLAVAELALQEGVAMAQTVYWLIDLLLPSLFTGVATPAVQDQWEEWCVTAGPRATHLALFLIDKALSELQ